MNYIKILLISILISKNLFAQEIHAIPPNTTPVWAMSNKLDDALLQKDTAKLQNLLHKDLTLGHSNGWLETKESLLKNLPTSKIHYHEFKTIEEPKIHHSSKNLKTISRKLTAIGELEDYDFDVDLQILEIWIFEDDRWQLIARQSVEVDFDK